MSVFCVSLPGSDSKMRNSTTGGGSTGRRSADAILDGQQEYHRWTVIVTVLTLCPSTASSGALRLLHHTQLVGELFAFASDPGDGMLRLVMRRHYWRPGGHFGCC